MKFKIETVKHHGSDTHHINDGGRIYRGTIYIDGINGPSKTVTVTAYGNYSRLSKAEKKTMRPILKTWARDRLSWANKPIRIHLP